MEHASEGIGGMNYVAAVATKSDRDWYASAAATFGGSLREGIANHAATTIAFVEACFAEPLPQDDLMMVVASPLHVREGVFGRSLDIDRMMSRFDKPVLIAHGAQDISWQTIISEHAAPLIPDAELSIYPGAGHSPFYENAERFNRELAAFVRAFNGR